MHIAHFTNTYLPVISGVVRSVSAYRAALTELGHNVFVFAQETDVYTDTEPFIFRYPAIKLPIKVDTPAIIPISNFIETLLPSLKLDIIHAHHPVLLGQTAANKAEEMKLPLVFTFHTQYREYTHYFPLPQEIVQDFLKGAVVNWLGEYMTHCHHIIVPTEGMRRKLEEQYGLSDQVSVIPTGIDLRPYAEVLGEEVRSRYGWENDMVLISVGRLAKEKNWTVLIDAVVQLLPDDPQLRLVILGEGPERDELEKRIRAAGAEERIQLIGRVPFDEVPNYLRAADIFGFASTKETQGLVTLEAMASGLPVVAVDATGTSDVVVDGVHGILTPDDPVELASALRRMLSDSDLRRRCSEASLERSREYDILKLARRMEAVYHQAIEAQCSGRTVKVLKHYKRSLSLSEQVRAAE